MPIHVRVVAQVTYNVMYFVFETANLGRRNGGKGTLCHRELFLFKAKR